MPIVLVGETLADLERQLETLKKMGFGGAALPQVDLDRKIRKLKQRATRTTGKVWAMVVAAATFPEGQEFAFADLATAMSEEEPSVRSWHRVLARSLKRLEFHVFEKVSGSSPARFRVPAAVRSKILEIA
jgi:hypothetical protein